MHESVVYVEDLVLILLLPALQGPIKWFNTARMAIDYIYSRLGEFP